MLVFLKFHVNCCVTLPRNKETEKIALWMLCLMKLGNCFSFGVIVPQHFSPDFCMLSMVNTYLCHIFVRVRKQKNHF